MLSVSFFAGLKESGYIIYKTRACERGQEFVSEPCWVPIFQSALFRHRGGLGLCLLWRRVWSRDAMAPPPAPPALSPTRMLCVYLISYLGTTTQNWALYNRPTVQRWKGSRESQSWPQSPAGPCIRDSGLRWDLIPHCLQGKAFAKLFNHGEEVGKCFSERVGW